MISKLMIGGNILVTFVTKNRQDRSSTQLLKEGLMP